jgi:hypothetical protein
MPAGLCVAGLFTWWAYQEGDRWCLQPCLVIVLLKLLIYFFPSLDLCRAVIPERGSVFKMSRMCCDFQRCHIHVVVMYLRDWKRVPMRGCHKKSQPK